MTDMVAMDWRLRASPEIRDAIERVAHQEERSLSSTARVLMREALQARGLIAGGTRRTRDVGRRQSENPARA